MTQQQIIALALITLGVLAIGLIAYFTGRSDGKRTGTTAAAMAADKVLALQKQCEQERQQHLDQAQLARRQAEQLRCVRSQRDLLQAEVEKHTELSAADAASATSARAELARTKQENETLSQENARLKARIIEEELSLGELEETVNEQCEQLAALNRDNATAAATLEETVAQLNQAEARSLADADLQHLQHAARQLGQQAAQFRRTGSQKTNHADIAAQNLQRLLQRLQPPQQSEEPSPRQAA